MPCPVHAKRRSIESECEQLPVEFVPAPDRRGMALPVRDVVTKANPTRQPTGWPTSSSGTGRGRTRVAGILIKGLRLCLTHFRPPVNK